MTPRLLVAAQREVLSMDTSAGGGRPVRGLEGQRPTGMCADPWVAERVWCCTSDAGVFRSDDAGLSWVRSGLAGERLMTITAGPAKHNLIWAGTEPSRVWRSDDGGTNWEKTGNLETLPSSSGWAFPPRPETHHVRWIAAHPSDPDRLWVAIEAGALISTRDGGRTWIDRVPEGPYDTHELAVHPQAPEVLRVAAGDGYFESHDGGESWSSPRAGLEVRYLRSVAIDPGDPEVVIVSAATGPYSTYVAGRSDGRVYRREGDGRWHRITDGWPDPPGTIAPLLLAGTQAGELWAADERGVHRSEDGGLTWTQVERFDPAPQHLRGIALAAFDERQQAA